MATATEGTPERRATITAQELESRYPDIPWREPEQVTLLGLQGKYFCCRLCVAMYGLHASQVRKLPQTREEVLAHIEASHPMPVLT